MTYRQAESVFRAEGEFAQGAIRRSPDGQLIDEAGVVFDVVGPQEGGAVPLPEEIAAQVMKQLKSPPPGKRRVILELKDLPPGRRLDVMRLLARTDEARQLADKILIHDRTTNTMTPFTPDDVK